MVLFYFLLTIFGLLGYLVVGLNLSAKIENDTIYMLFWMLYTITFFTFLNVIATLVYYNIMKNKKGPRGKRGIQGDRGDSGDKGICSSDCKDQICVNNIKDAIRDKLRELEGKDVSIDNVYINNKIKQICSSNEFKQVAPYNGPLTLINYLAEVWTDWTTLLHSAGSVRYFETIGAETEWEWVRDNPFDEMKKYDIFYWGLGKDYKPELVQSCASDVKNKSITLKVCKTNNLDLVSNTDGINSINDASIWRARPITYKSVVYYPVGDIVIGPSTENDNIELQRYVGDITMKTPTLGPNRETILVAGDVKGPLRYELIWDSSKEGSNKNIYVWRPIGPRTKNGNYLALGDVITTTPDPPLSGTGAPIRCIKEEHLIKINHNRQILWSSEGVGQDRYANLLGFVPHRGGTELVSGDESNAYNLFRGVRGNVNVISASDKNAQFYTIKSESIDPYGVPGIDPNNVISNSVDDSIMADNSGYQPASIKKSGKYSIQAFIELKNESRVVHRVTNKSYKIFNASSNISNSYLITIGKLKDKLTQNNCLQVNDSIIGNGGCLSTNDSQYFMLEFTGNEKGQVRIKHNNSRKYLLIVNGLFRLSDNIPNKDTRSDPSLFNLV